MTRLLSAQGGVARRGGRKYKEICTALSCLESARRGSASRCMFRNSMYTAVTREQDLGRLDLIVGSFARFSAALLLGDIAHALVIIVLTS